MINYAKASPEEVRKAIRRELIKGPTADLGAAPAIFRRVAVVPRGLAFDFLLFAQRNPKACPILDVADRLAGTENYGAGGGYSHGYTAAVFMSMVS